MDIKLLVATHKVYKMPKSSIYLPIQVGAAINEPIGYQTDSTGDSISEKNKNYCELTALYWGWKNLDVDVLGLVHYRRHFGMKKSNEISEVLDENQVTKILKEYDIIVPKKRNYIIETNYKHYIHAHHKEPLDITREIISEKYPEYLTSFDQVMNKTKAHMFNMFIMKKEKADEYCEWLFDILFDLEKKIDISTYDTYEARVFGFVSELLLDVWLIHKKYLYKEVNWNHMEKESVLKKGFSMIKRKYGYQNEK